MEAWREDWNDYDGVVALSIFGVETPAAVEAVVSAWARERLGQAARITWLQMSVGAAVGLELADGARLFLKAWPGHRERAHLTAQMTLQARMAAEGYPAPATLSEIEPFGAGHAVLMAFDRRGEPVDAREPGVAGVMARGLARFARLAEPLAGDLDLPGADWPRDGRLWPRPHTAGFDFATSAEGAEWIDAMAGEAKAAMRAASDRPMVTHHDWSAKNMRMAGGEIAVLYDWDSVFRDSEILALGAALAFFPMSWDTDGPNHANDEAMAAFLADYEDERGARFATDEVDRIAAAVTYSQAYVARCEHCGDDDIAWEGSWREAVEARGPVTAKLLRP